MRASWDGRGEFSAALRLPPAARRAGIAVETSPRGAHRELLALPKRRRRRRRHAIGGGSCRAPCDYGSGARALKLGLNAWRSGSRIRRRRSRSSSGGSLTPRGELTLGAGITREPRVRLGAVHGCCPPPTSSRRRAPRGAPGVVPREAYAPKGALIVEGSRDRPHTRGSRFTDAAVCYDETATRARTAHEVVIRMNPRARPVGGSARGRTNRAAVGLGALVPSPPDPRGQRVMARPPHFVARASTRALMRRIERLGYRRKRSATPTSVSTAQR